MMRQGWILLHVLVTISLPRNAAYRQKSSEQCQAMAGNGSGQEWCFKNKKRWQGHIDDCFEIHSDWCWDQLPKWNNDCWDYHDDYAEGFCRKELDELTYDVDCWNELSWYRKGYCRELADIGKFSKKCWGHSAVYIDDYCYRIAEKGNWNKDCWLSEDADGYSKRYCNERQKQNPKYDSPKCDPYNQKARVEKPAHLPCKVKARDGVWASECWEHYDNYRKGFCMAIADDGIFEDNCWDGDDSAEYRKKYCITKHEEDPQSVGMRCEQYVPEVKPEYPQVPKKHARTHFKHPKEPSSSKGDSSHSSTPEQQSRQQQRTRSQREEPPPRHGAQSGAKQKQTKAERDESSTAEAKAQSAQAILKVHPDKHGCTNPSAPGCPEVTAVFRTVQEIWTKWNS
mmetsp:Transcript_90502/g.156892  ORF Transcript_90502/g.156892 Transcript_90502/m.156892 type:complete len:397 (+) Transcript_90502:65-1255(+)